MLVFLLNEEYESKNKLILGFVNSSFG